MSTRDKIMNDLKTAMKEKDAFKRDQLRLITAAFKQAEVDTRQELTEDDVIAILKKEVKSRQETIADQEKAGRDTSEAEAEMTFLQTYLPEQMSRNEIEQIAKEVIAEVGATDTKDMGKVMGALMPRLEGRADGKEVNQVVRQLLNS
jgi:uncharacterized protein YqeY